jgi:hypothetical protein
MNSTTKRPIPVTPILRLYREMRRMSQAQRLRRAYELAERPDELLTCVRDSIEQFNRYDNIDEPFCPTHTTLTAPAAIFTGRTLAAALAQRPHQVDAVEPFSFTLVDYEVPPARTTIRARLMQNQFADGTRSTTAIKIDLLLKHEDGTPIIAEAKVAKPNGYDTDSTLALVQALAGATHFATPNQQARLARHYPRHFKPGNHLDVAVVAYQPATLAKATYQQKLNQAARELAKHLQSSAQSPRELRTIHFLTARGHPLTLTLMAQ